MDKEVTISYFWQVAKLRVRIWWWRACERRAKAYGAEEYPDIVWKRIVAETQLRHIRGE